KVGWKIQLGSFNKKRTERRESKYSPNEEWKGMELEKNNANHGIQDCIEEYEMIINDKDLDYMTKYLFSEHGPAFMKDSDDDLEKEGSKFIGSPSERIEELEQEFEK
ncbi:hypothetical protein Tco_1481571, partial [Tanacetum coccineum]